MRCLLALLLVGCPATPTGGLPSPATMVVVPTSVSPRPPETLEITVVGYNVESGDAEAPTIAENIQMITGEAIWGFSECASQSWLDAFVVAAADDESQVFDSILGSTGGSDRLAVAWDTNLLTYVSHEEVFTGEGGRDPLVVTFDVNGSSTRFKFMVNHLFRGNEQRRHNQADFLNRWASSQPTPIIAAGDYNFDWGVDTGDADHDLGYDLMTADSVWEWVRPDTLIRTQCSPVFDSVLDFVFVAGEAQGWEGESEILLPAAAFCRDNELKPDHRPVSGTFAVPLLDQ